MNDSDIGEIMDSGRIQEGDNIPHGFIDVFADDIAFQTLGWSQIQNGSIDTGCWCLFDFDIALNQSSWVSLNH